MASRGPLHPVPEDEEGPGGPDDDGPPPPKRRRASYPCRLCDETFTENRSLVRHMRAVHAQSTRVQCSFCPDTFAREDIRKRHERRKHPDAEPNTAGEGHSTSHPVQDGVLPGESTLQTTSALLALDEALAAEKWDYLDFMDSCMLFDVDTFPLGSMDWNEVNVMDTAIFPTHEEFAEELVPLPLSNQDLQVSDTDSSRMSILTKNDSLGESSTELDITPSTSIESNEEREAPLSNTEAGHGNLVYGMTAQSANENVALILDIDHMSMNDDGESIVSISTHQSHRRRTELPLGLLKSRLSLLRSRATPRGRSRNTEVLCMLCNKPFGYTHTEIRDHLHRHDNRYASTHTCTICQIDFVNEADFRMHKQSSTRGHCGFQFEHAEPCTGHHAPIRTQNGFSDHDSAKISSRLLHWEQAQLQLYLDQVSDLLSNDAIPPDVDSWSINVMFSRSRESLSSLWTNATVRSTPNPLEHRERISPGGKRSKRRYLGKLGDPVNEIRVLRNLTSSSYSIQTLASAILTSDNKLCKKCIAAGVEVDGRVPIYNCTPLYLASQSGQADIVDTLIQAGADLDRTDDTEFGTALCAAAAKGFSPIVTLLLEAGATVDLKGTGGDALAYATKHSQTFTAEILQLHGAKSSPSKNKIAWNKIVFKTGHSDRVSTIPDQLQLSHAWRAGMKMDSLLSSNLDSLIAMSKLITQQ